MNFSRILFYSEARKHQSPALVTPKSWTPKPHCLILNITWSQQASVALWGIPRRVGDWYCRVDLEDCAGFRMFCDRTGSSLGFCVFAKKVCRVWGFGGSWLESSGLHSIRHSQAQHLQHRPGRLWAWQNRTWYSRTAPWHIVGLCNPDASRTVIFSHSDNRASRQQMRTKIRIVSHSKIVSRLA